MSDEILVILGSSRKSSDTRAFLELVMKDLPIQLLDLLDYPLYPYDYQHNYKPDDRFDLIAREILQHQTIVFATPVYWYSMSAHMKILFDRFTDLLYTRKEWGRKLRGKSVLLLAVGADKELPEGFTVPFRQTSTYLNMNFKTYIYYSTEFPEEPGILEEKIRQFRKELQGIAG